MPAQHEIDTGWRKSSYSGGDGNNGACVEIAWHRSSYSAGSGNNGNCVEVAAAAPGVAVRDSKTTEPALLAVPNHAWHAFVTRAAPDTPKGTMST